MARKKTTPVNAPWALQRFQGKTFAFAGRLYDWHHEEKARALIHGDGAQLVEEITPALNYLVIGERGQRTEPRKKAEKLNKAGAAIEILSAEQFFQLFLPDRPLAEALLRGGPDALQRWGLLAIQPGEAQRSLDLSGTDLQGMSLPKVWLGAVKLDGADLSKADLTEALLDKLKNARLDGASLAQACLTQLIDCSLRGANLHAASLWHGVVEGSDFTGADLSSLAAACLTGKNAIFRDANLSGANLYNTRFQGTDFTGADLTGTRLEKANLSGATLTGARLHQTDFREADLRGADLRNADLTGALLLQADLSQALVEGANFEGAHLGGTLLKGVDCSKARGLDPVKAAGPGKVGPNIRKLAQAAQQAKALSTSIRLNLPDGHEVGLHCSSQDSGKKLYCWRSGDFWDHRNVQKMAAALLALPRRWAEAVPQLDSVKVSAKDSPLPRKELKALALAAWCEALGVPIPTADEIKQQKQARQDRQQNLHNQFLADLRGGAKGVQRWNKQVPNLRQYAGPYRQIDLPGARLRGVDLSQLDFTGANFDNASLLEAKLGQGTFANARFRQAKLDKASLEDATLRGVDFTGASLRQASLNNASCPEANFQEADLTGADLSFANLCGADLSTANLTDAQVRYTQFDQHTLFPSGFILSKEWRWAGAGTDPRRGGPSTPETLLQGEGLSGFLKALASKGDPARLTKALEMLKAERFQLFSQVEEKGLVGVVKSQSDPTLVYSCRLASDGSFSCCTQNLNVCGGLRGALCKHLLVLIVGLTKSEKLDPAVIDQWVSASRQKKPILDKDAASAVFLRYKGAEAGEVDWRPTETIPEDFYAL